VTDQVARFGGELKILTAEGDNADIIHRASELSDAVAE
jgi:hypothetical protein